MSRKYEVTPFDESVYKVLSLLEERPRSLIDFFKILGDEEVQNLRLAPAPSLSEYLSALVYGRYLEETRGKYKLSDRGQRQLSLLREKVLPHKGPKTTVPA